MKTVVKFVLLSSLLTAAIGCSGNASEAAAEEARVQAAEARVEAANANTRATAADANVRAADARVTAADARVRAADADVAAAEAEARIDERISAPVDVRVDEPVVPREVLRARTVIPSGTLLKVSLIDSLSSDTNLSGDRFMASIVQTVLIDGVTLLPAGTKVRGRVVNVEGAGKVRGRGAISLELTDIVRANGRMLPITTERFEAEADDTHGRDAGVIAGGAGVGAVVGAIIGGKKGAAIGAATGGAGGTGVVLATKGKEIQYGPETRLDFTLTNSVQL